MSSSQSYYRKIYERFNKNESTVSLSDCIESEPDINESNNEINSELDVSYCKYNTFAIWHSARRATLNFRVW